MVEAGHTKLWLLSLVLVCCVLGSQSEMTAVKAGNAVNSAAAHATAQQQKPALATAADSHDSDARHITKGHAASKAFHMGSAIKGSSGLNLAKGAPRGSPVAAASAGSATTSRAAAASEISGNPAGSPMTVAAAADPTVTDQSSAKATPADAAGVSAEAPSPGTEQLLQAFDAEQGDQLDGTQSQQQQRGLGWMLGRRSAKQQPQQQPGSSSTSTSTTDSSSSSSSTSTSTGSSSGNGSGSGSYVGAAFIERRVKPLWATIKSKASIVTRRARKEGKEGRHNRADLLRSLGRKKTDDDSATYDDDVEQYAQDNEAYTDSTYERFNINELIHALREKTRGMGKHHPRHQDDSDSDSSSQDDSSSDNSDKDYDTYKEPAAEDDSSHHHKEEATHHKKGAEAYDGPERKHVKRVVTHRASSEHKPKKTSHSSTDTTSSRKARREHTGSAYTTRSRAGHKNAPKKVQVMEVNTNDFSEIKALLEAIYQSDSSPEFLALKGAGYEGEIMSALRPHIITDDPDTFINSALAEIAAAVGNETTQASATPAPAGAAAPNASSPALASANSSTAPEQSTQGKQDGLKPASAEAADKAGAGNKTAAVPPAAAPPGEDAEGDIEYEEYEVEVEVDDDTDGELDDDVEVVYIDELDDADAEADLEAEDTDAADVKGDAASKEGTAKSDLPTGSQAQEKDSSQKPGSSTDTVAKDNDSQVKKEDVSKPDKKANDANPAGSKSDKDASDGEAEVDGSQDDTEVDSPTETSVEADDDSKADSLPTDAKLETQKDLKHGDYGHKEDKKDDHEDKDKEQEKEKEKEKYEGEDDKDGEELYEDSEEAQQHKKHKKHAKHHQKHTHRSKGHKHVQEDPEEGEGADDDGFKTVDEMDFEKEDEDEVLAYPEVEDCSDGRCKLNCTATGEYAIPNCLICLPDNVDDDPKGPVSCSYCKPGYYLQSRTKCVQCPKGAWCGGTKLKPCPEGFTTEEGGRWSDSQCTLCAAGYGTPDDAPGTPESRLICNECPLNTFNPTDNARPCQHCPANTLSINLATGRFGPGGTQCLSCPEGLEPNEDGSDCRCPAAHPHCKCPAGWASVADTGMVPCALCGHNDTYADRKAKSGSSYCKACPKYSVSTDGTSCACKPGYWSDDGTAFAPGGCIACEAGSITAVTGSIKCSKCPYGTAPNADRTQCKPTAA